MMNCSSLLSMLKIARMMMMMMISRDISSCSVQEGVDDDLGDGTDTKSTLWWAMLIEHSELKESISLRMLVTYFYEKNGQRSLDRPTDSKMPTSNSHYPLCSFSLHYSAAMTSVTQSDWTSVTSWGRECKWLKRAKDKRAERQWPGINRWPNLRVQ